MSVDEFDIHIKEVGPRDGLQNEKHCLPLKTKIDFIHQLSRTGLRHIEVGSFVSAKAVPQMADTDKVFQQLQGDTNIEYSALVPNLKGLESALQVGCQSISIFTAATDSFCQHNIRCDIEESLERFQPVMAVAKESGLGVRAYISCIFACPYEGNVKPQQVISVMNKLLDMGVDEISLGDTTGVGTVREVNHLLIPLVQSCAPEKLACHYHNTYGQAIANILASLEYGIKTIDSAVAGLGGCPYAKGASGNVPTEEVLYALHGLGLRTGVDLAKIVACDQFICNALGIQTRSAVAEAMLNS